MDKTKTTTIDRRTQRPQVLSALLALLLALTMLPALALAQTTQAHAVALDPTVWDGTSKSVDWYLNNAGDEDYLISTAAEFAGFAAIVNGIIEGEEYPNGYLQDSFVGKTVKLDANLNLADFFWQEIGATASAAHGSTAGGTVPATTNATSFQGVFDGQGHTIANIYLPRNESAPGDNDATNNYKGLFGRVEIGAVVRNVGVTSGTISGSRYVGGITGMNWGLVENCFNGATIISNGQRGAGGIAGNNYNNGGNVTIRNCYNYGTIISNFSGGSSGHGFAAGITASNENLVENCYNIGSVTSLGANYGGIVGYGGKVHDSYMLEGSTDKPYASASEVWISGAPVAAADLIKSSESMRSADFVLALGDAFKFDADGINNGYPILAWQGNTTTPPTPEPAVDISWYNTTDTSFELSTKAGLAGFAAIVNGTAEAIEQDSFAGKTVTLAADIALDENGKYSSATGTFGSSSWPMEATYYTVADGAFIWTPIGSGIALGNDNFSEANYFEGIFDGAGYTVSGLYTDGDSSVQGLFGNVRQGTVKNLTVEGCVVGTIVVGAAVAHLVDGTVTNITNNAIVCADGGETAGSG
ncbi:MAG: hypothetical protein LBK67_12805, partial [Coriobacteriales bacterium]|nr:hypothetical protein [Coriobacteriales bacterium]